MPRLPIVSTSTGELAGELGRLAEQLRRVTVQIRGYGEGSGVVWRESGLIVTNAHVARGLPLWIRLPDGRRYGARLLARDPERDLAALTVPAQGLTAAIARDASSLRTGELVVALGHPFGIPDALALGIVHEVVRGERGRAEWLRADIRLAPGNSGGPLADALGRVVGINTLIAGGLGHAIPAPTVERFLQPHRQAA